MLNANVFFRLLKQTKFVLGHDFDKIMLKYTVAYICLSLFEIASLIAFSSLISIGFYYIGKNDLPPWVVNLAQDISQGLLPPKGFVIAIAVFAVTSIILKNLAGLWLSTKIYETLAKLLYTRSNELYRSINAIDYEKIRGIHPSKIEFIFSTALPNIVIGNSFFSLQIISELVVLSLICTFILVSNFQIGLISLAFFGLSFFIISRAQNTRLSKLSMVNVKNQLMERRILQDTLQPYKEHLIYQTKKVRNQDYASFKSEASNDTVQLLWLQQLPKYIYEIVALIGLLIMTLFVNLTESPKEVLPSLILFFVASSRMTPSILRLQQATGSIRANLGATEEVTSTFRGLFILPHEAEIDRHCARASTSSPVSIKIKDLYFEYTDSNTPSIADVNLEIQSGSFVALVGPSGSGKTTFADLILGVLTPTAGSIDFFQNEKLVDPTGSFGYVPQITKIIHGSIKENIIFYRDEMGAADIYLQDVIASARLEGVVEGLVDGINTRLDPTNPALSIGQLQRIGIARALYRNPRILIMDEATSALDADSEKAISECLDLLQRKTTVIVIAHRLSTVAKADLLVYFEGGRILGYGKFNELRKKVKDFDRQAQLLGL
jgi:ABC-type multidrug transport system fused ATPase/permease subunit